MAELVQTLLVILVAQLVDGDTPPLQQMRRTLAYALVGKGFPASIELQDFGDVGVLEMLDGYRQCI